MRFTDLDSDGEMLTELGRRLERRRLARNITQADLAQSAGVGLRTLKRLEAGEGATAANLMRILRSLELLGGLDELLPGEGGAPAGAAPGAHASRRRASRGRAAS